ncbi:MAG: diacylglycerol kinase [Flavobacteriales bacterium]|nr:MAG: diacylglycerol kinase [Flavobacteriales bacterium]
MNKPKRNVFAERLLSLVFVCKGIWHLLRSEHSIIIQTIIGVAVTLAGFWFQISPVEWMIQTLAIGLVLGVEAMNTAVEKMADFIHPEYHKKIGIIKDISAAAVGFVAISAVVVSLIIYLPKIL